MRTLSSLLGVLLLALCGLPAQAQMTLYHEGFDFADFSNYDLRKNHCTQLFTFNQFLHDGQDYLVRGTEAPAPASYESAVTGYFGNYIMAEDYDGAYGGGAGNLCIQLHPMDITGITGLQLQWRVSTSGDTGNPAPGSGRYEEFDALYLDYAVDGGAFMRAGYIRGGHNSSGSSNFTTHDDDGDGYCDANTETRLTGASQVFTYDLPGVTGSSLVVRVYLGGFSGSNEEVQFDDLMVLGSFLPVELADFDALADGNHVYLTWQTLSETDNVGFGVQHQRFGEPAAGWTDAAFVAGHGTTSTPQTYRAVVPDLQPGQHLFRLKQVDTDGSIAYSPTLTVEVDVPGAALLTAARPNPFNATTSFTLSVQQAQHVTVAIYDLMGRQVAHLHDGPLTPHEPHTFTWNAGEAPSGIYFYRATGTFFTSAARTVVLMK